MCEVPHFNFNDLNLDFLDCSTPPQPTVRRGTPIVQQHRPSLNRKTAKDLAVRIASTDALVQRVRQLEEQLQDFQQSAQEIQKLYETEKQLNTEINDQNRHLKESNESLDSELANKTLQNEQLKARLDDNTGPVSYNELALLYLKLARKQVDDDYMSHWTRRTLQNDLQKHCEAKQLKVPPLPSPKKRLRKCEKAVQCTLETEQPEKAPAPTTRTLGTQYTHKVETRSQWSQHISTTTTRSTSTSCFIKKHHIGTSFPEPIPLPPLDDILQELLQWDAISPVSPILEQETPSAVTTTKSIGTCTDLCNIQRTIDFMPPLNTPIKRSDSRPPSRLMYEGLKLESVGPPALTTCNANENPQNGTPPHTFSILNRFTPFSTLSNMQPSAFEELWQMFGQMLMGLLQHRGAAVHTSSTEDALSQQEFHNWMRSLYDNVQQQQQQTQSQPTPETFVNVSDLLSSAAVTRDETNHQCYATSEQISQSHLEHAVDIPQPRLAASSSSLLPAPTLPTAENIEAESIDNSFIVKTNANIFPSIRLPTQNGFQSPQSLKSTSKSSSQLNPLSSSSPVIMNESSELLVCTDAESGLNTEELLDCSKQKPKRAKKNKKNKSIKKIRKQQSSRGGTNETAVDFLASLSFQTETKVNNLLKAEDVAKDIEEYKELETDLNKSELTEFSELKFDGACEILPAENNCDEKYSSAKETIKWQRNENKENKAAKRRFCDVADSPFGSDLDVDTEELNTTISGVIDTQFINQQDQKKHCKADRSLLHAETSKKMDEEDIKKGLDYLEDFFKISNEHQEHSSVEHDNFSKTKESARRVSNLSHSSVFGSETDMESLDVDAEMTDESITQPIGAKFAVFNDKRTVETLLQNPYATATIFEDKSECKVKPEIVLPESSTESETDMELVIDEQDTGFEERSTDDATEIPTIAVEAEADETTMKKENQKLSLITQRDKVLNKIANIEKELQCTHTPSQGAEFSTVESVNELNELNHSGGAEATTSSGNDTATETIKIPKKRGRKRKTDIPPTAAPVIQSKPCQWKRSERLQEKKKILESITMLKTSTHSLLTDKSYVHIGTKNNTPKIAESLVKPAPRMFLAVDNNNDDDVPLFQLRTNCDDNFQQKLPPKKSDSALARTLKPLPTEKHFFNTQFKHFAKLHSIASQQPPIKAETTTVEQRKTQSVGALIQKNALSKEPMKSPMKSPMNSMNNQSNTTFSTSLTTTTTTTTAASSDLNISYDSPASPSSSTNDDVIGYEPVKLIPLELVTENGTALRNQNLLHRLVSSYSNQQYHTILEIRSAAIESKRRTLIKQLHIQINKYFKNELFLNPDHEAITLMHSMLNITDDYDIILTAIIELICKVPRPETELACSVTEVPEKYLGVSHQRIIYVLRHLHKMRPACTSDIVALIEHKLFNYTHINQLTLNVALNLTQLYLIAIGNQWEPNRARLFVAKCLYYHKKRAVPMIYEVLCVYPTTLPHREERTYDRSDPLITVLQHLLMVEKYDVDNAELRGRELLSKLRFTYHYEPFKPLQLEVLDNLYAKLTAGKLTQLSYAYALICKRMQPQQVEVGVLRGKLLPLANEYYALLLQSKATSDDALVAAVLECISMVLKPFPLNTDITAYLALFARFLNVDDNRPIIQEAALNAILRLQRFGYANCFNVLYNFKPTFKISSQSMAMLRTFVHRKPVLFWQALLAQSVR